MNVIEKANMDTSIHFSQQFLICEPEKYEERLYPVLSKFISNSVSTIRNPDIPEITHGSIYLLKYLYRGNHGNLYISFSDLSKQLQNDRIMEEGHPELVQSCLRQLDEQGYVITTGTVDDPQYIVLNPLHVLQTMDESLCNTSDPHVHAGLYSQKFLSSLPCVELLMTKLSLSMAVPDPLVNLVMKQDLDQHVGEHFYFSPQFTACHKKVNKWTCQPGQVFSCGLHIVPVEEQNFFPSQLILTILFKAIKYFTATFLTTPSPPLDCVLRKNGIQWMANNVEVLLEVGSCVVVMGRSDVSNQLQCMDMFVKTVNMVLDVKGDHCGGIPHKVEVLDPNALVSQSIPPSNELLWCDASSAARALRIGRRHIQSTCKSKEFPVKKLDWLHRFSLQGKSLFDY